MDPRFAVSRPDGLPIRKRTTRLAGLLVSALAWTFVSSQAGAQGVRDTEIEGVIRDYATPIFSVAGVDPAALQIILINDPSINAFAAAGPIMGMNTGTIIQAETPNEIIGVIAHEAGHVAGGHSVRSGEAAGAATATTLIALGLGILAIAAGAPDAGAALIASSGQFGQLSVLSYSREQESRADQAGATFLEGTGQSVGGLVRFFEKLRAQEYLTGQKRYPYFRSHPLSSDRVQALQERLAKSPYQNVKDSPEALAELHMIQGKIHGFLEPPQTTFYRYPPSDQSLPARYARAIALYRLPDTKAALGEIDLLLQEQPLNPFFHELKGQILFEAGRTMESIAPHRKSVELFPKSALLKINLGRSLLATDNPVMVAEGMEMLKKALLIEPDNAFAWEQLAIGHDKRGEIPMANLATAEAAYNVGARERAFTFAQRARISLDPASSAYRRASDIIAVSRPEGRGRRGRDGEGPPDGDGGQPAPDGEGNDNGFRSRFQGIAAHTPFRPAHP